MKKIYTVVFVILSVLSFTGHNTSAQPSLFSNTDPVLIAVESSESIRLTPGMKSITYDIIKTESSDIIFDRWGNLKSGSGEYIQMLNKAGSAISNSNISKNVETIQPPVLVSPKDGEIVSTVEPVLFTWLPPTPTTSGQTYKIKIVEVSGDQSPENAIHSKPFFEKEDLVLTYMEYPSSAPNFALGGCYAWQVETGESEKMQSEVRTFYFGQREACITWSLLSSDSVTSIAGNITGQNEILGAGPAPAMSVFNYNSFGQRLWVGNTGWIAGSLEATRYIEFNTLPASGSNFKITNVSFNYGDNQLPTDFSILNSQAYYSKDNWATSTALSQNPLVYLNTSMTTFTASNLNISITSGQKFSLRIYPYAVKNGNAMTPTFAVHNNVRICGISTPQVTTNGSICGTKFNDLNGNGVMDVNEPGLPNWTINLTDAASMTAITDASGNYCFENLKAGKYTVGEVNQSGWQQTAPSTGTYSFELSAGENKSGINFGNKAEATLGSICGTKFNDLNGNGVMDVNEPGLANWTIQLSGADSRTVVTDSNGNFCFDRLKAGVYNIVEVNQTGWVQTMPAAPGTYAVTLTFGQKLENINFGNKYDPDAGCSKVWEALGSGMNNEVFAYANDGNIIYAGGDFTTAGGTQANYIAKWNGTSWTPLGSGLNGKVRAIAVMGSDVYVGGMFTMAGGVNANKIAKWNGTSWSALGNGVNGTVLALKFLGNDLYVGGSFSNASGVPTRSLAKWDGTSWSSPGGGVDNWGDYTTVLSLAVMGSDLYAGGRYYLTSGLWVGFTEKWNGTSWSEKNTFIGSVDALAVMGTDLYVGGWFNQYIRKWNGTTWSTPGGGTNDQNDHIHAFAVIGTDLYAGGAFTTAGGVSAYRVAKWNGSAWSALGNGVSNWSGSHGHVESLLAVGNVLYAGGGFDVAGTVNANYAAKYLCSETVSDDIFVLGNIFHDLNVNGVFDEHEPIMPNWTVNLSGAVIGTAHTNSDGNFYFNNLKPGVYTVAVKFPTGWTGSGSSNGSFTFDAAPGQTITGFHLAVKPVDCDDKLKVWSALGRGTGAQVSAIIQMGNDIYAGGAFTDVGNHIAKWDGASWSPLGSGINGDVNALAIVGTDLFAGGSFTTAGGVSANNIAKWDGSNWSALGTGINGTILSPAVVRSLAVIHDDLYAAGNFTTADGITVSNIAKWDGNGWSAVGSGTDYNIYALAVLDHDLYAGGNFLNAGGVNVNHVAKWDGTNWSPLGSGVSSTVTSLASIEGELFVGGDFPTAGGVNVNRIAKWDGTNWSALGNGIDNNYVRSITAVGSNIYAGGDFTTIGGVTVNHIAKWDGTNWSALGTGMNQFYVNALVAAGGDLYAGGWFNTVDGLSANNIAKYSCNTITSVDETYETDLPRVFKLEQNYPNPFHSTSTIGYYIPQTSEVKISVYNIFGKEVKVLVNEEKYPGHYEIIFDGHELANGIYFCTMKAAGSTQSKKMILMK